MERAEVRGSCGTRQAHVGREDGKSPFRGAERWGGMSATGRHAETAPRHTPGVCGAALPLALLLWPVPREILA